MSITSKESKNCTGKTNSHRILLVNKYLFNHEGVTWTACTSLGPKELGGTASCLCHRVQRKRSPPGPKLAFPVKMLAEGEEGRKGWGGKRRLPGQGQECIQGQSRLNRAACTCSFLNKCFQRAQSGSASNIFWMRECMSKSQEALFKGSESPSWTLSRVKVDVFWGCHQTKSAGRTGFPARPTCDGTLELLLPALKSSVLNFQEIYKPVVIMLVA